MPLQRPERHQAGCRLLPQHLRPHDIDAQDRLVLATCAHDVQALYRQAGDRRRLGDNMAWGQSSGWKTSAPPEVHPDSIKAGQTYFDLHALDPAASSTTWVSIQEFAV